MSADEQVPSEVTPIVSDKVTDTIIEQERSEKILKAKELYNQGSRNFLVKSYAEAADELSQVCALYEELYGYQSDELGMPYLLYAKSLIALALDENKVIDVPDEEALEEDEEDVEGEEDEGDDGDDVAKDKDKEETNGEVATSSTNGTTTASNAKSTSTEKDHIDDEADSTAAECDICDIVNKRVGKTSEDEHVSSTDEKELVTNGTTAAAVNGKTATVVMDGEKPSTSNGETKTEDVEDEEDENEAASNLQLAWEILELAAKIFARQGMSGLPNLAEVQTELANIEFENNIPESAREDYEKALKIYCELLSSNYRRAMAEIHYKIGLTYLMQQMNSEASESLKEACALIDNEILEIQEKANELTEKDKSNIQDMEETRQEIWVKITEIEDAQIQNAAEVRAALDNYIKPVRLNVDGAGPSSSSASCTSSAASSSISSTAKPTDISHLVKRKKPDEQSSEAEAAESPAKRPAV